MQKAESGDFKACAHAIVNSVFSAGYLSGLSLAFNGSLRLLTIVNRTENSLKPSAGFFHRKEGKYGHETHIPHKPNARGAFIKRIRSINRHTPGHGHRPFRRHRIRRESPGRNQATGAERNLQTQRQGHYSGGPPAAWGNPGSNRKGRAFALQEKNDLTLQVRPEPSSKNFNLNLWRFYTKRGGS